MLPVDEFGLIARLFTPLSVGFPGALGLTDDAALVPCAPGFELAITTDALVAGEHFLATDPPDAIARKAIRTNVSDLAAMGSIPRALLLAVCLPHDVEMEWLDAFADGMRRDLAEFSVSLIGGDTVGSDGPLMMSITAIGEVEKGQALRRSNARPGDLVWVSGTIGDGALGLFVELGRAGGLTDDHAAYLLERYRVPRPRVALGRKLVGVAHAAMDVSDGLIGDLGHICDTSGVGAVVEVEKVPFSDAAKAAIAVGLGAGVETALTGGDDYELLFTAPPEASRTLRKIEKELDLPLSPIGRIVEGRGVSAIKDGQPLKLAKTGHRHF